MASLLDQLRTVLGEDGVLEGQDALDKAHSPWTRLGESSDHAGIARVARAYAGKESNDGSRYHYRRACAAPDL